MQIYKVLKNQSLGAAVLS